MDNWNFKKSGENPNMVIGISSSKITNALNILGDVSADLSRGGRFGELDLDKVRTDLVNIVNRAKSIFHELPPDKEGYSPPWM